MTAPLDVKALRALHHAATVTSGELGLSACAEWAMALEDNASRLLDAAEAWHEHEIHADTFAKLDAIRNDLLRLQREQCEAALARAESAEATCREEHDRAELWSERAETWERQYRDAEAERDALRVLLAETADAIEEHASSDCYPLRQATDKARAALTAGDGPGKAGGG